MSARHTDTIARQFLWWALPLSALLMAAIWAAAAVFVDRTIRHEGQTFVVRHAEATGVEIRSHLYALIEAARIVSQNELLVGALLDESGRAFVLPAFMRSLRLPGISAAGFALLDYGGSPAAVSGPAMPDGVGSLRESDRRQGEHVALTDHGLRAAFPVRYDRFVEGYLLVWVPAADVSALVASVYAAQLGKARVRAGDVLLFDSCCGDRVPEIASGPILVGGFPSLQVEIWAERSQIFPAAFSLNWFLLGAFGADIVVLLAVSLLAADAIARPLRRMVREIRAAPGVEHLRIDGYDKAPREVRFLAGTLNAAAATALAEIQRRQEALRQAEAHAARNELLAAVIEHSNNAITIQDAHGAARPVIYANAAYFRMTGYEPSEVIGMSSRLLETADPAVRDQISEAEARGREIQIEILDRRKDGSEMWGLLLLFPVREPGGAVSYIIGVRTDITEQRRLRDMASRSAHLTSLGEMATGLAHELNQPLNVIRLASLNLAGQLGTTAGLPPSVNDKLARIQRNIDRAAGIIEHMKVFGRGDSGPAAPFRLRDAVDGALQIVGAELRNAGIDIRRRFGAQDPFARGKPMAVEQVAVNLAINARDAILARRMRDGRNDDDWIEFGVETHAGWAVLSVEDTGGGVPEAIRERVFEPFFTTKPPGKGTGLGLSLSFGIAAEMGGSIVLQDGSRGARFDLRLPIAQTEERAAGAAP